MRNFAIRILFFSMIGFLISACYAGPIDIGDYRNGESLSNGMPQPADGISLPPRNLNIADAWPSDLRKMIDDLISLYSKGGGLRTIRDVEEKMRITLTEDEKYVRQPASILYKRYKVGGSQYAGNNLGQGGREAYYKIWTAGLSGRMTQSLALVTSKFYTGFCLNPYELATYTGLKFVNGDVSAHSTRRFWEPAYVWGMFKWSATGRYVSEDFVIELDQSRDINGRITSAGCVGLIEVMGRYTEE